VVPILLTVCGIIVPVLIAGWSSIWSLSSGIDPFSGYAIGLAGDYSEHLGDMLYLIDCWCPIWLPITLLAAAAYFKVACFVVEVVGHIFVRGAV